MINIPKQVKDIAGKRFGRLVVVGFHDTIAMPNGRAARWQCRCDCGTEVVVIGTSLRRGNTSSCGCISRERTAARNSKHGDARRGRKTPEYTAWRNMIARCYNPKSSTYHHYGGRGIAVCDRWRFGEAPTTGFECFLYDMGRRPSPQHSIDRYPDRDGDYRPGNTRWATQSEQVRNSKKALLVDGLSMIEAAESVGADYSLVRSRRQRGWDIDRAMLAPKSENRRIVVNGIAMTISEAARISPITREGIDRRIRQGWEPEAAVLTPRQKTGPKPRGRA
jgi:hypothetical protein